MSTSPLRRRLAVIAAPALATAIVVAVSASSGSSAPGAAALTLTATGLVQAPQQLALSFAGTGRIADVDVRAGEHVHRGTVLARLDPGPALAGVQTASANLASARAQLVQLRQGLARADRAQLRVTLEQSRQALAAAARSFADSRAGAAQDERRLRTALGQANAQLAADREKLAADQAALAADQSAAGAADGRVGTDRAKLAAANAALLDAQDHQADDQAAPTAPTTLADDAKAILARQADVAADQAQLADDVSAAAEAHSLVATDNTHVGADQTAITADENAVAVAGNARSAGVTAEQQSVDTAEAAVAAAHLGVTATQAANAVHTEAPRVGALASARAAVRVAEAALATAEEMLSETRLVAPFSGTIAAVNALTGQVVGGGAGASGAPLFTLVNLNELTVTASFDSAQAALLATGRTATATIPALADEQITGRLVAVDPMPDQQAAAAPSAGNANAPAATNADPQATTSPTTYTATFALTDAPPALLPGTQAQVTVSVPSPAQ